MTVDGVLRIKLVVLYALLGSCIGSFLNVVVWRVPQGRSIVSPPSACPHCGHVLSAAENVPIIGWLALRGRCRSCRAAIAARYPAVELGTALAFGAVALATPRWFDGALWPIAPLCALVAAVITVTLVRHDTGAFHRRILAVSAVVIVCTASAALVIARLTR